MQERQRLWSAVRDWTSCRVQVSFHARSVTLEWAATASSAIAASTGCTRNAVGSCAWKKDPDYRCTRCQGTACPLDGRPQREVQVGPDKLEVVASFCYLGDMLSEAVAVNFQPQHVWKPPGRSSRICYQFFRHLSFKTRGCVYSSCVRSALLHASTTWPLTKPNLQYLQQNNRAMIRQICNVRPQDIVTTRSNELLVRLGIEDLDLILKERRLRWYGHVEHSKSRQPLTYRLMENMGLGGPRWHGNSWQRGIAESGSSRPSTLILSHTWRSGVRSAIRAASQLSGRGPTGVVVAPVPAR